jgi:hypothetical protein
MASIIAKTIRGATDYFSREVARVGAKPKIISERYLADAADIEAALAVKHDGRPHVPPRPRRRHCGVGDGPGSAVTEVVDEVVGARRSDAGASVGTYLALATLRRVVDPSRSSPSPTVRHDRG